MTKMPVESTEVMSLLEEIDSVDTELSEIDQVRQTLAKRADRLLEARNRCIRLLRDGMSITPGTKYSTHLIYTEAKRKMLNE